jgi:hypothetical protein
LIFSPFFLQVPRGLLSQSTVPSFAYLMLSDGNNHNDGWMGETKGGIDNHALALLINNAIIINKYGNNSCTLQRTFRCYD